MIHSLFCTSGRNIGYLYFLILVALLFTFFSEPHFEAVSYSTLTLIKVYENAERDKNVIFSDNKGKTGIYMWTHLESGKIYIGSAADLSKRLKKYYSPFDLKRANNRICNALICHTHSAFSLSILEYIDISNLYKKEARVLILSREQFFLDTLLPDYNILKVAGSSLGHTHSTSSKALMSEAQSGENNNFYGKTHTAETKALISEANSGLNNPNFGKSFSAETRAKMSAAQGTAIFVYDSQGELVNSFSSARRAASYFNCSKGFILKCAKNGELFKNEWTLSLDKKLRE